MTRRRPGNKTVSSTLRQYSIVSESQQSCMVSEQYFIVSKSEQYFIVSEQYFIVSEKRKRKPPVGILLRRYVPGAIRVFVKSALLKITDL
jgi:hypothetical protein